jgi:hypothetical protein
MISVYDTQEAVPEALREHYKEEGGKWVLFLEGDHPAVTAVVTEANAKVGEFRNNNISANQALDAAKAELAKFTALGLTPEVIQAQASKVTELEGKVKGSKTQDDLNQAIAAALKPVTDALAVERQARLDAVAEAGSQRLESTLTQAGVAARVTETAMADFLARGKREFSLVEGQVVAMKDGAPVYSTKRPGTPLTVEEWASNLQAEAPHLYKASTGGGEPGEQHPGIPGGERTISANDISDNLEDVALGKARVAE